MQIFKRIHKCILVNYYCGLYLCKELMVFYLEINKMKQPWN